MTELQKLLLKNKIDMNSTKNVLVGYRYNDDMELCPFEVTIKKLATDVVFDLQSKATKIVATGKGNNKVVEAENNQLGFYQQLIKYGCTEPNFLDADFIEALGVMTPEQAILAVIYPDEIAALASEIYAFSSAAPNEFGEAVEATKNS